MPWSISIKSFMQEDLRIQTSLLLRIFIAVSALV